MKLYCLSAALQILCKSSWSAWPALRIGMQIYVIGRGWAILSCSVERQTHWEASKQQWHEWAPTKGWSEGDWKQHRLRLDWKSQQATIRMHLQIKVNFIHIAPWPVFSNAHWNVLATGELNQSLLAHLSVSCCWGQTANPLHKSETWAMS